MKQFPWSTYVQFFWPLGAPAELCLDVAARVWVSIKFSTFARWLLLNGTILVCAWLALPSPAQVKVRNVKSSVCASDSLRVTSLMSLQLKKPWFFSKENCAIVNKLSLFRKRLFWGLFYSSLQCLRALKSPLTCRSGIKFKPLQFWFAMTVFSVLWL